MESDIAYVIRKLREAGLKLYIENGIARGEMQNGGSIPYSVMPFVNQYRASNEQAVQYLTQESVAYCPVRLESTDMLTAKAVKRAIQDGKVELTGRLIYHKSTNRIDITYLPKVQNFDLDQYRDILIFELKRRLNVLEEQYELLIQKQTVDDWDEAKWKEGQPERDALMEEYNRINLLLMEGGAA